MKDMDIRIPKNALDLHKQILQTYSNLRAGGISVDNAKAQAALIRGIIDLMKIEIVSKKALDIDPIYSPTREFFGDKKNQICDNSGKENQEK